MRFSEDAQGQNLDDQAHEAAHEEQGNNLADPGQEAAHGEEEKGEELERDLWYSPSEEWGEEKEEQKKEELKRGLWYSPSEEGGRAPPWHNT